MEKVAILIPTRNRPNELAVLLESIAKSSILPKQVVIVASGDDVSLIASKFSKSLEITYLHTEIKGQIAQKRIGVELVRDDIDWCLFLDDDLVLEKYSIELALNTTGIHSKKNVIGIGLSLPPLSRAIKLSRSNQRFLKLFKLFSSQPGKVLSSGHAVSYLQEKEVIETQWLNGLSMWRVRFARHYGKDLPSTPYAACEDLIFSYPLSKVGTLLYVPEAKADFQSNEKSNFDSIEVLRTASLWRYYFVTHNKDLSFKWFYVSQVPRSIFAIWKTKNGKIRIFFELITLNLKILSSYIRRESSLVLLNELRN